MSFNSQILFLPQNIEIMVFENNRLVDVIETRNRVVYFGLDAIADLFGYPFTTPAASPRYIALGTNSTATIDTATTLGTEVFRKEISRKIPLARGVTIKLHVTTSEANGNILREVGLFASSAGNQMYARAVHDAITKTVSISIVYAWTISFTAS